MPIAHLILGKTAGVPVVRPEVTEETDEGGEDGAGLGSEDFFYDMRHH